MKREPTWKFSNLKARSFCIFYPNLPKTSPIHKMSKTWNIKYLKWKLASEINNFVVSLTLIQNFFQFQIELNFNFKLSSLKTKIKKICRIKIHIWEKHPWNLINGCFEWMIQKKVLEDLSSVGGALIENKTSELQNSEILK